MKKSDICEIDGENIFTFENDFWKAETALTTGGNLIRLLNKKTGIDLLRFPESIKKFREKPQVWGIPVLFPPNRIKDGKFTFNGKEYRYPVNEPERQNHLHGFLLKSPRELDYVEIEHGQAEFRMSFSNTPDSGFFSALPHEFRFEMTYSFSESKVTQTTSIINQSNGKMPFALGFHTAFRLPFGTNFPAAASECAVRISTDNFKWEMTKRRHLPTGAKIPFEKNMTPSEGFDPSGKNVSVHCPAATLCENGKSFRGAILTDLAAEAEIVYEIDEIFKHWSLWNSGGNENFFCPEPQSCMINAPNLALPEDITGFSSLNPGEKKETVCRISLRKLC